MMILRLDDSHVLKTGIKKTWLTALSEDLHINPVAPLCCDYLFSDRFYCCGEVIKNGKIVSNNSCKPKQGYTVSIIRVPNFYFTFIFPKALEIGTRIAGQVRFSEFYRQAFSLDEISESLKMEPLTLYLKAIVSYEVYSNIASQEEMQKLLTNQEYLFKPKISQFSDKSYGIFSFEPE
ncbi:MAG: hypothetical protein AB7I41_09605 [Candidatus Sericytochromatia bacterium]